MNPKLKPIPIRCKWKIKAFVYWKWWLPLPPKIILLQIWNHISPKSEGSLSKQAWQRKENLSVVVSVFSKTGDSPLVFDIDVLFYCQVETVLIWRLH